MVCFRPGDRSRLIYSFRVHRGRKGEPKGFTWQDYRDLVVRAHNQLKGPIVLVWDNLRTHLVPQEAAEHDDRRGVSAVFLTCVRLVQTRLDGAGQVGISDDVGDRDLEFDSLWLGWVVRIVCNEVGSPVAVVDA
ncbi:hypothetical protein AB0N60_14150 [Streptomyces microflavus]